MSLSSNPHIHSDIPPCPQRKSRHLNRGASHKLNIKEKVTLS